MLVGIGCATKKGKSYQEKLMKKKPNTMNSRKSCSIIPVADILSVLTGVMVIGALSMAHAETSTKNKELEKNTPSTTGTQRSDGRSGLEAPQSSTKSPEAEKMAPDTAGTRNSEGNSGNIAPQTSTKNREAEERAKEGTSAERSSAKTSSESVSDQQFLLKAAQGGLTEVKLGELAQKKGSKDDVRDFGKMMVKDHTKINHDVKSVAAKNNVDLPKELDAMHQQKVDDLSKLSGAAFDKAYLDAMATAHAKDLAMFKAQRASTNDPALKESLDKAIPVVESHISHLQQVKL
jgi:putative membrane protein